MKITTKTLVLLMLAMVLLLCAGSALAETHSETFDFSPEYIPQDDLLTDGARASSIIHSSTIVMDMPVGGNINATIAVSCNVRADSIRIVSFTIYEQQANGTWKSVASSGSSSASNAVTHSTSVSYRGTTGRSYQCRATIQASYNGETDTRYPTSSVRTAN